jgi:hypothetical protein
MKEFKFCGEMTEYVEIPVYVCETQKEMVKEISEIRDVLTFVDEARENLLDTAVSNEEETSVYIIYKDGSIYFKTLDEEEGKFKRYGIKAAVIETAYEYTVFGDFAVTDNGDISIEESDIEEYGVYAGQYDVKEQTEETAPEAAETAESVEETTVSETETVETEIAEKVIMRLSDDDGNVLGVKMFVGTYKQADEEAERIMAETGCDVSYVRYTDSRWNWMIREYYCGTDSKSALSVVVRKTETAEQETELNAEVAQVEAEQTAEPETFSKSKSESESEPTAENITVSGTNQGNINVPIVADVINAFETITHTGYFDTS